ncbi:hypothetical protein [Pseudomonas piscis]|uniref:hypothetical protein n=1 Tax=Pseudomonas piscis TaxID=2614538 RepID=UPI0021D59B34|nr:hypothetical protein [Pseudomonas piscis]MCU7647137.1 hypothetical protein [Pseudomonas piscis]
MTQKTYTVFLPDRPSPICVEADDFAVFGCELVLHKGDKAVARTSDRGFVVLTEAARESCAVAKGSTPAHAACIESIAPSAVAEVKANPALSWSFFAGAAFGALCVVTGWLMQF